MVAERFKDFVGEVWAYLGLPSPTPVQNDICDYLQDGPKRLVIMAFRGVGKSWITSAFVVWQLLRNPQIKILVVSASKVRADDFSTFCFRIINEMPGCEHLKPNENQRNSKISWDVGPATPDHAPSVKSVGVTGQMAGSRADLIVADDVEIPSNSGTLTMREKIAETVKEFDAILKPDSVVGRIMYLGTPQCEESLYNKLPDRGYVIRIWPSRYPTRKQLEAYSGRLAPFIADALEADSSLVSRATDPRRFTDLDLSEREASYGRAGFALQFQLDTRLSDAERYPLKLSDLIVLPLDGKRGPVSVGWGATTDLVQQELPMVGFGGDRYYKPAWIARDEQGNPQYTEYTGACMFIDPSGRGKDECAYAVVKMLNGYQFLTAIGGFRDGYTVETLKALATIAKDQEVKIVLIEANFGDGMFTELFKPALKQVGYPCTVEEVKHNIQKERRICDTLEPVMMQHRLVVSTAVIQGDYKSTQDYPNEDVMKYQLFYQMTRITREKGALIRDDRLDALAGAVAYWVLAMAQDNSSAAQDHRARLLDEELEQFMSTALGRQAGASSKNWVKGWSTRTDEGKDVNKRMAPRWAEMATKVKGEGP